MAIDLAEYRKHVAPKSRPACDGCHKAIKELIAEVERLRTDIAAHDEWAQHSSDCPGVLQAEFYGVTPR
jgi:hypothetical protein